MAATRLVVVHKSQWKTIAQSLKERIDYTKNDEKTEQGKWISSYACNAEIADQEFHASKAEYFRKTGRKIRGDIIAYQIRQSFKPGEITPEEANRIGYETAMRFTKGEHAFIVTTHTDRAHIHNHVTFNSTNLACDRKFRDSWFIALALQRLSDIICLENGLSVIKPRKPSEREKYTDYPKRDTIRSKICEDIEMVLLKQPVDFEEFLRLMREHGYEIKIGKYPAVKGIGQKRFIRFRSLDAGYTQADIENRIRELSSDASKSPTKEEVNKRYRSKKEFDLLIDIQEKMRQGKGGGYTKWATVYNIKQMAQTLLYLQDHDIRDYEKLEGMTVHVAEHFRELTKLIKDAEQRMTEIAVLKTHIFNYAKTKEVYVNYRKAGYSKKYFEEHREEITLHKAAREAFSNLQEKKIPKIKELNEEYAELLAHKKEWYSEYRKVKKEMQDMVRAKHNVDEFLGIYDSSEKTKEKNSERDSGR